MHHPDPQVPLHDSAGTLEQLRQEGKIAVIGLSNVTVAQLDEALAVALIETVQNRLSYSHPGDLPTARACAERNVTYLAYMPLGGPSGTPPTAALAVARRRGVSVQRVLLAWLREQAPNIVPLVGASRPASIRDSAASLDLADQDLADLYRAEEQRTFP
jgi:pyridoxine 4-dehydrogenase